jgi:CubicO group peptidase (beta-lactamase class C family)
VQHALDAGLANRAYPGAIAVVGNRKGVLAQYAVGHLDWAPSPVPDVHTIWDLASLTKVVGVTTAMMQLVDAGKVDVDAPVQRYLPDWVGPHKELVTVRHLLTHTAGLPAFEPYDRQTHDADSLATLMFTPPLDTLPGVRMVYSDIGGYLLGKIIERVSGESLDRYVRDHIFGPLHMNDTMFQPPDSLWYRVAPTEFDSTRGGLLRGHVHDERAYYLGGVSGHAGLFSSAADLTRFARMMLNGGTLDGVHVVSKDVIEHFTAKTLVADRALGWQKPNGTNSAGHRLSDRAFGHTGFTGTSIWMDPTNDVFIILLSNRVDPTRANNREGRVRVALADSVMAHLR